MVPQIPRIQKHCNNLLLKGNLILNYADLKMNLKQRKKLIRGNFPYEVIKKEHFSESLDIVTRQVWTKAGLQNTMEL